MPEWAAAELAGDSDRSSALLDEADKIALGFAVQHHDEALDEVVALADEGDSTRRKRAASRAQAYARARRSYAREEVGECVASAAAALGSESRDALGMFADLTAAPVCSAARQSSVQIDTFPHAVTPPLSVPTM